ncbi:hypothetical protein EUX98_g2794 [Antrodiella citrinella]|uniref:F-box domain-containing protein n=1 Tax=Antrodiella citrinella TaxID=2447956 RepID=A0A4S4MY56_9APHY|nr:hypothetical protein EUX98_g2794 [Antrodiella citrinella]
MPPSHNQSRDIAPYYTHRGSEQNIGVPVRMQRIMGNNDAHGIQGHAGVGHSIRNHGRRHEASDATNKLPAYVMLDIFEFVHGGSLVVYCKIATVSHRWRAIAEYDRGFWRKPTVYLDRSNARYQAHLLDISLRRACGQQTLPPPTSLGLHGMSRDPDATISTYDQVDAIAPKPRPPPKLQISIQLDRPYQSFEQEDRISGGPNEMSRMKVILDMSNLAPRLHLVEALVVKTAMMYAMHAFLAWGPAKFPALRTMKLFVRNCLVSPPFGCGGCLFTFPVLKSLVISAHSLLLDETINAKKYFPGAFPALEHLTINDYDGAISRGLSPEQFLNDLSCLPGLTHFTIDRSHVSSFGNVPIFANDRIPDLKHTLSSLQELHFSRIPPEFIHRFLLHLDAPALKAITFEGAPDDINFSRDTFAHLQRAASSRFGRLDTIRFIDFYPSMFCKIAGYLDFVRNLMLRNPLDPTDLQQRGLSRWSNWPYERMQTGDLPKLQSLHLEESSTIPNMRALYRMLVSRKNAHKAVAPLRHLSFSNLAPEIWRALIEDHRCFADILPQGVVRMDAPAFTLPTRYWYFEGGASPTDGVVHQLPATYRTPRVYDALQYYTQ